MNDLPRDVPSPIDLRTEADAQAWTAAANRLRPWRSRFFEAMCDAITPERPVRILELGAGPGFLAEQVLRARPAAQLVLLDFSEPMQALARERLRAHADRVSHVCRSFKGAGWAEGLGRFDYVLTNQAVHELRHKRYAEPLHRAVRAVLNKGGRYLVSDHYFGDDGMKKPELYMSIEEQRQTLLAAGFGEVLELLRLQGMVLHSAA